MKIRLAKINDLRPIIDIYNQAIHAGNATADLKELTVDERIDWFKEHSENEYPIYVVEKGNKIIGWGSLSPYRKRREGLKTAAEISYYIDYHYHDLGYGKKLIAYMINDCKRLGIKNIIAMLLEINELSILILEKFGFTKWGFMPNVADINGIICGHVIYGKHIYE